METVFYDVRYVDGTDKSRAGKYSVNDSDISHQMKTPLANIMLYSELLQEQTEGEQEKYLAEQIETYAKKLEFLTTALVKNVAAGVGCFKSVHQYSG